MGSGSYGGGGGGGGGTGGTGGNAAGPGYRFKAGKLFSRKKARSTLEKEVHQTIRKLPKEYLMNYFASSLLRGVYEQLFQLSVEIFQNKSWKGVAKNYGVGSGEGCLTDWVDAVVKTFQTSEPNQKVRETVRICLEDFLTRALGNDPDLLLYGSSADVLKKLDQKTFNSTSAFFLGNVIWRLIERERESEPTEVEHNLWGVAEDKANQIVDSFSRKFRGKEQTTYRDLFKIIQQNNDWFLQELRK